MNEASNNTAGMVSEKNQQILETIEQTWLNTSIITAQNASDAEIIAQKRREEYIFHCKYDPLPNANAVISSEWFRSDLIKLFTKQICLENESFRRYSLS